ncbi:hypothetical protein [Sinorhizobium meliloti]|uniref:hypothetical protein n=1 Tax=Rhizobium meliloti TaxID=382 RepID=UPI000FD1B2BA|nr:hypothetical protein [Sinorhizobium meliloti]MDE3774136.1 hypothetical protein [Sinorhizobium meliloti]MDE3858215.1 hypothetical protein [Sinorhizobium meliloti]MDE4549829.1 hypothetical protein [Sinorhizobium meliloti]MDE4570118.1 hypothetical protein [Sinorhizobium meliloti]MDE4588928.1 hypothetical protein [Sinorhizobium meliloti]
MGILLFAWMAHGRLLNRPQTLVVASPSAMTVPGQKTECFQEAENVEVSHEAARLQHVWRRACCTAACRDGLRLNGGAV